MSTDRSPRVYVVQRPAYRDRKTGEWVYKFGLKAAEEHGRLVYLLPPGNLEQRDMDEAMARLRHRLEDYEAGDHLLAAGDPVAIAAAVLIAGLQTGGRVSLLKWDRIDQQYYAHAVNAASRNDG